MHSKFCEVLWVGVGTSGTQTHMARIVFMGTPQFAVSSLLACLDLGDVVAVVTQPDKPRGRGQEVSFSPVKEAAVARGLPVLQPQKIKGTSFADELRALSADVAVVTAYGKILPQDVLDTPRLGCVNVHASLLPRFRGAAPIQWAIAHGDTVTGVCLMKMDAGMDTGPVIARKELPISPNDTSASLHDALAALGGAVLRESLPGYLAGQLSPVAQPTEGVVMAPMIRKEDGHLDFTRPALVLERRLRAFTPWPGAFVTFNGSTLKITQAVAVSAATAVPGTVLSVSPEGIEVACAEGALRLTQLQPEGKKPMSAREFLNGRPVTVGSRPFS